MARVVVVAAVVGVVTASEKKTYWHLGHVVGHVVFGASCGGGRAVDHTPLSVA